jgi:DNA primase
LPHVADNKSIRFLFLPAEHDPDSYVREEGTEAFAAQVRDAMPLSRFLLQSVTEELDMRQPEGRARAQYEAKPLLQAMPAGGLRLQIIRELADATGTTPAEIEALCGLRSDPARAGRFAQPRPRTRRQAPTGLEQRVLQLLMCYPTLSARLDEDSRALLLDSESGEAEVLAHLVAACDEIEGQVNFAAFSEHLAQSPYAEAYAAARTAVLREEIEEEPATQEFDAAVTKLLAEPLSRELERVQAAVIAGTADEEAKQRMRWLVSEIQRRRRHG